MKPSSPLLLCVLTLAVAGCGGGTVIDPEAAEEDIRANLAVRDITVSAVDCPSDVETGEGRTYECEVATSRGHFRVIYRQLDADGSVSAPRLVRLTE